MPTRVQIEGHRWMAKVLPKICFFVWQVVNPPPIVNRPVEYSGKLQQQAD
jgi:hypothetical protein